MRYIGNTSFEPMTDPRPSKSEYGMDVIRWKWQGAADKLDRFLNGLRQGMGPNALGQPGQSDYAKFGLQTWEPDDDPIFPVVTLMFKGLVDGTIPPPIGEDDASIQTVSMSTATPEKASREIQFWAFATRWRYITDKRPTSPQVGKTSSPVEPTVISSVIRKEDGRVYPGNAPTGLVSALTPAVVELCNGWSALPIIGTPYFEVEETVIRTYKGL